ncbi:MAG: hypothetical protein AAB288_01945 [Acidobacteriota bacterium]
MKGETAMQTALTTRIVVFFSALSILFTGCATLKDAQAARGSGMKQIYSHPVDVVWAKTTQAITSLGPTVVSENKAEGSILAETTMSAFSAGEKIAVFIKKIDESKTEVEVISKKAIATNVFAYNWEKRVHDRLAELLALK